MSPCIDAPCCGCCELAVDAQSPEVTPDQEADEELDDDGELQRDRILEDQERSDFAKDDLPELDDELRPWDWVTD